MRFHLLLFLLRQKAYCLQPFITIRLRLYKVAVPYLHLMITHFHVFGTEDLFLQFEELPHCYVTHTFLVANVPSKLNAIIDVKNKYVTFSAFKCLGSAFSTMAPLITII